MFDFAVPVCPCANVQLQVYSCACACAHVCVCVCLKPVWYCTIVWVPERSAFLLHRPTSQWSPLICTPSPQTLPPTVCARTCVCVCAHVCVHIPFSPMSSHMHVYLCFIPHLCDSCDLKLFVKRCLYLFFKVFAYLRVCAVLCVCVCAFPFPVGRTQQRAESREVCGREQFTLKTLLHSTATLAHTHAHEHTHTRGSAWRM